LTTLLYEACASPQGTVADDVRLTPHCDRTSVATGQRALCVSKLRRHAATALYTSVTEPLRGLSYQRVDDIARVRMPCPMQRCGWMRGSDTMFHFCYSFRAAGSVCGAPR